MREFIKKYEIWVFLILGPIHNVFFVYSRLQGYIPKVIYNTGRFCVLLLLLIIILKYTKGNEGIKNLFKPMRNWKVHPKWYFLSLIFAVTVAIVTLLLKGFYYELEFSTFLQFRFTTLRGFVALFLWAFLGEVVWVSYCIRELSKITKPFYAGQIVAFFWTLWFIPIALLGEGVFPDMPIMSLLIFMMGAAGMCAFVYGQTKSGICVFILQYMVNLTLSSLPITPTNGGASTFTAFAVLYFVTMLAVVYVMSPVKKFSLYRVPNN